MSLFSLDFIRHFEERMLTAAQPAHADWVEGGYLFIVPPENAARLEKNVALQRAQGAR